MGNTNNTTASGTDPGGQSNMLGVDLSNLSNTALASGGDPGFDLTVEDTNNPEEFAPQQHPPAVEHQQPQQQTVQQQPQQQQPGQTQQQPQQSGAAQPNQQQSQPQNVDIASIIRETLMQAAPQIGAAAVTAHQQQVNAPQVDANGDPKLSLEELEQKFAVVRLSQDQMTELGFDAQNPKQRESLEGLLHATAKMATAIAAHQRDKAMSALQQQFAPVMQYVQQAQIATLKNDFFSQNPELKEHEQLLGAIYAQLKTSGFQGTNEQWFEKVGSTAKTILDRVRGTGGTNAGEGSQSAGSQQQQNNGGQQTRQQQPGSQTTHRMTTLSGGGQGGASQGSGGKGQTTTEAAWNVWA